MPRSLMVTALGVACFALALAGCDRTESDWAEARRNHTVAAYENFLIHHPDGNHAVEARVAVESLEWESMSSTKDAATLATFIARYPASSHLAEAKARYEALSWENARGLGTAKTLGEYVKTFPAGAHLREALDLQAKAINAEVDAALRASVLLYVNGRPKSLASAAVRTFDGVPFDKLLHGMSAFGGTVEINLEGRVVTGAGTGLVFTFADEARKREDRLKVVGVANGNGGLASIKSVTTIDGVLVELPDGATYQRSAGGWVIVEKPSPGAATQP